jgi:hypothetical protein
MPEIMAEGLCVGHPDPDLWQSEYAGPARRAQAVAICNKCPALADCREWSLQLPARENRAIYGGLSANQRVQLKKQRKREQIAAALPPHVTGMPRINAAKAFLRRLQEAAERQQLDHRQQRRPEVPSLPPPRSPRADTPRPGTAQAAGRRCRQRLA